MAFLVQLNKFLVSVQHESPLWNGLYHERMISLIKLPLVLELDKAEEEDIVVIGEVHWILVVLVDHFVLKTLQQQEADQFVVLRLKCGVHYRVVLV